MYTFSHLVLQYTSWNVYSVLFMEALRRTLSHNPVPRVCPFSVSVAASWTCAFAALLESERGRLLCKELFSCFIVLCGLPTYHAETNTESTGTNLRV